MNRQRNPIIFLFVLATLCLLLITPARICLGAQSTGTLDLQVSQSSDDAEEVKLTHWVGTTSSDLEMVRENLDQIVGIRFDQVDIPKGSKITSAYLVFTADEKSWETTNLQIWGESNKDAKNFESKIKNISDRTKTTAMVKWDNVPGWGRIDQSGLRQQTPDLSAIVQEVIDVKDWDSGKPIVFIIDGSGKRVARSYDKAANKAPKLHIEYTTNTVEVRVSASSDDAEQRENAGGGMDLYSSDLDVVADKLVGIRFLNIDIPQGADITNAYIEFTSDEKKWDKGRMWIDIEAIDNPNTFSFAANNISNRNWSGNFIQWKPVPKFKQIHKKYQTPDLTALVQKIVGRSGWKAGNAMSFLIEGRKGTRPIESYDCEDSNYAPLLHIEYGEGTIGTDEPIITTDITTLGGTAYEGSSPDDAAIQLSNTGTGKLEYEVTMDATWLSVSPAQDNLDAGKAKSLTVDYNTTGLAAGTHEATITITDPDAINNPVEIQVSVTIDPLPDQLSCGHVPVYTENLVSPAILILLDVSGSMRTMMDVSPQGNPRTPDLSSIVQELVDRAGWQEDNAMAFIVEGSGHRTAVSYNGDSARAPLLHVKYIDPADSIEYEMDRRVSKKSDDAEESIKNTTVNINSSDLELINDGGDQVVGLRFQNVPLPNQAIIKEAYIEFEIDETNSETTSLTIWGEGMDNPSTFASKKSDISGRAKTAASVAWNKIDEWSGVTQKSRIDIGKEAISDLVKDRAISWGYGTWCARDPWSNQSDRTFVHEGTKPNDDIHQQALQDAIAATTIGGGTPFSYSIDAASNYYTGKKKDKDGAGSFYTQSDCQPKFLIEITDGQGNSGSTVTTTNKAATALADNGVSGIGVGFGLPPDESEQLFEMAKVANDRGDDYDTDDLYDLHEVVGGIPQPFFAYNKQELVDALNTITESIKGAIFHGSAPAPTTSADLGDMVIMAQFDASRWSGDVKAVVKDDDPTSATYGMWAKQFWSASDEMPATRSLWTIDPSVANKVIAFDDSVLANDNFACFTSKPIGDIINSTPVVVGHPPFFYPFDDYFYFKDYAARDTMVYIGANDGSLHAFDLASGAEKWAFVPKSMHDKLNQATIDPLFDRCAPEYCHQYFIDGSPIVGDVYADFSGTGNQWRTVLVGSEREGGETYFALDVTSGKAFDDASEPTKFLWEFSDPQLGQSWAEPSIERVGVKDSTTDTAWGVFFGSGYLPDAAKQAEKQAYLYGILAHDALDLWKDDAGNTTSRVKISKTYLGYKEPKNGGPVAGMVIVGDKSKASATIVAVDTGSLTMELDVVAGSFKNGEKLKASGTQYAKAAGTLVGNQLKNDALASPLLVDLDADYIAERIYAGNLYGNMYRVTGIKKGAVPSVSTLFTFDNTSNDTNPIRGKAGYAYADEDDTIWLYFGSGRYEDQLDKTHRASQYFMGVKDWKETVKNPLMTYRLADLVQHQAKFVTADVEIDGTIEQKNYRVVEGSNTFKQPWAIELFGLQSDWGLNTPMPAGSERALVKPLIMGGMVFFVTFIPDENICAGSGTSWLFAVDYQTGLVPDYPVWDINGDGMFNDDDMIQTTDDTGNTIMVPPTGIYLGRGQASNPVYHDKHLFITTTGSGDVTNPDGGLIVPAINVDALKVGLRSWEQR